MMTMPISRRNIRPGPNWGVYFPVVIEILLVETKCQNKKIGLGRCN